MCDCIPNINEKLGEKDQSLPMAMRFDVENARMGLELVIPLTRKDGKPERRNSVPKYASPSYCPFCGEKAND